DEGAVSEADWGRESLKAFAFLVNTGKDGTCSLPQSLRDSSLIRGSLVRSQQPSERKRSFSCVKSISIIKFTKILSGSPFRALANSAVFGYNKNK
ncbi:MAG: hypothetical protein SPD81_05235, partial [Candidatus Faecousia sp.]|nr:hypothetical protein [Candidatus Faecousia sp.]